MTIEQDRYREHVNEALLDLGVDPTKVTVAFDGDLGDRWPKDYPGPHLDGPTNTVYTVDYPGAPGRWYSTVERSERHAYTEELARLQAKAVAFAIYHAQEAAA